MTMTKEKYVVQVWIKGERCPQLKVYNDNNDEVAQRYCPDIESECETYDELLDYVQVEFFNDWDWSEFNELVDVEVY